MISLLSRAMSERFSGEFITYRALRKCLITLHTSLTSVIDQNLTSGQMFRVVLSPFSLVCSKWLNSNFFPLDFMQSLCSFCFYPVFWCGLLARVTLVLDNKVK